MGDLGAGTSTAGSGLSGIGQQIADLIGGLIGSADGTSDAGGVDSREPGSPGDAKDSSGAEHLGSDSKDSADDSTDGKVGKDAKDGKDVAKDDPGDHAGGGTPGPDGEPVQAAETPPAQQEKTVPIPTPVPLPPEPPPPVPDAAALATPDVGPPTPCEIAADELPQVGEAPS